MKHEITPETIRSRKLLAARIKEIRLRKGLSCLDAAVACDLNPNYYARIERGKTGSMRMDTVFKLRNGFNVKLTYFFDVEECPLPYILEQDKNKDEY